QSVFDKSMDCISILLNFNLMSQYKSHSFPSDSTFTNGYRALWDGYSPPDPRDTVSYLQHYLALFHNTKDTFLKYQASKKVKKDAAVFVNCSVPAITPQEEDVMSKSEIAIRRKTDAEMKKALVEQYKLDHSSYNMPKLHLMKHFGEAIAEFGELQAFSTSIIELNHQPLNLAYNKSNKVDATEQTLHYAGQKDTMNVRVANYTHLLQTSTADEEVRSEE